MSGNTPTAISDHDGFCKSDCILPVLILGGAVCVGRLVMECFEDVYVYIFGTQQLTKREVRATQQTQNKSWDFCAAPGNRPLHRVT